MQKVYLMSEFGTLFDPKTGECYAVEDAGRITAVSALRTEDVMGEYGYLAVVEQDTDAASDEGEKRLDETAEKRSEPVDVTLGRKVLPAVMIINQRNMRAVN